MLASMGETEDVKILFGTGSEAESAGNRQEMAFRCLAELQTERAESTELHLNIPNWFTAFLRLTRYGSAVMYVQRESSMADDSMVTEQLRQLTLNEQVDLEETSKSSSSELRQLLDAADELVASLGNDVQPPYDSTITEILPRVPELDEPAKPAVELKDADSHNVEDADELEVERDEGSVGCDPYNRYLT